MGSVPGFLISALSSGAAMSQGKKAQHSANALAQQQMEIQKGQWGLTQQQYGLGNKALAPASDYWNALLRGGQAAVQATGPIASQIGQTAEGNRQAILASTPRGGEQNLAIAQNYNQAGNNIARLYAGMQPLAAQGLQQLGSTYLGSGASVNPQASPYAAMQAYQMATQSAQQGAQGAGASLYGALQKGGGSGGGGMGGKGGGGGKGG